MPFATHPNRDGWRSEACRDLTGYDFDNQGRAELPIEVSMSCFSFTVRCQSEPNIDLSADLTRREQRGLRRRVICSSASDLMLLYLELQIGLGSPT